MQSTKGIQNLDRVSLEGRDGKGGDKENITWAKDWPSQHYKLKDYREKAELYLLQTWIKTIPPYI